MLLMCLSARYKCMIDKLVCCSNFHIIKNNMKKHEKRGDCEGQSSADFIELHSTGCNHTKF